MKKGKTICWIDEVSMFSKEDYEKLKKLVKKGKSLKSKKCQITLT